MLKKIFHVVFVFLSVALYAAVEPGQNLLINPDFEAEQLDWPKYWHFGVRQYLQFELGGGPKSGGALVLKAELSEPGNARIRQLDTKMLVAGETYKISAWLKSSDFKAVRGGILLHNQGWWAARGILELPENTDGWEYFEEVFTLMESKDKGYTFTIYAQGFSGELQIGDLKLEAISSKALSGTQLPRELEEQTKVRLLPWEPRLNHIPINKPQISFKAFGMREQKICDEHEVHVSVDQRPFAQQKMQPELNNISLAGLKTGDHLLEIELRNRNTGQSVFSRSHQISLVELAPVDESAHKRLNNFVVELIDARLTASEQSFDFDNPKTGWVYLALQNAGNSAGLSLSLSGLGSVIDGKSEGREAFRYLERGRHSLRIQGVVPGAGLKLYAISEIFHFSAPQNSMVRQNGKYDWAFYKKHVLPAVTTLNGNYIPDQHLPEYQASGRHWLANLGTSSPQSAESLLEKLRTAKGFQEDKYNGITCDEQFFTRPFLYYYTDALWQFSAPEQSFLYTWIVGKPSVPGMHSDFFSASVNASRGQGKVLFEAYCQSKPNEELARSYLQDRVLDTMLKFEQCYPNAAQYTGMIFGNFNQIPIISLDVLPEVDYKYFLDMQLHLAATDPAFDKLGVIGYWGGYYGDEELFRWSMRLLRHYCVEGKSEMLSNEYGYRYNPGHLQNCDFADSLRHWKVQAAENGSVSTASFPGYGADSQRRWGAPSGTGDSFCLLKRQAGTANRISQSASGLIPGRVYTLQFVTADYQDMLQKRSNPRPHPLKVEFSEGAEVLPKQSYVYVDRRNDQRTNTRLKGLARVNLHHVRFKAVGSEVQISFSDESAEPGEELALNYIMLKPYFEP